MVRGIRTGMFFLVLFAFNAQAWTIDASQLVLGAPPASGSTEEQEDYRVLHHYQDTRTEAECEAADDESVPLISNLFGVSQGVLTRAEYRKVELFATRVLKDCAMAVEPFKKQYHRPRPFIKDPTILPCIKKPDGTKSYPSGHATIGKVVAEVLSDIYPQHRTALIARGEQISENRVLGGVHHPSDIRAAEALKVQILEQLRSQPDYWDQVRKF